MYNERYYFYENIEKFVGCFYVKVDMNDDRYFGNLCEDSDCDYYLSASNDIFKFTEYKPFTECKSFNELQEIIEYVERNVDMKFLVTKPSGELIKERGSLEKLLDKNIGDITSNNIIDFDGKEYIVLYDDCFLLKHLPVNENCSVFCNMYIAGNAVIGRIKYTEDGDILTVGLLDSEIEKIESFVMNFDKSNIDFSEPDPIFEFTKLGKMYE